MRLIEDFRAKVVGDLFEMQSLSSVWPLAKTTLCTNLPQNAVSAHNILELGRHLSGTFTGLHNPAATTTEAEAQALVARGGALWEGLVVWYLNLCLAGTRAVAIKKKSHMPKSVRDALSVWIGNSEKLSEPDVLILHLDSEALDGSYARSPVQAFQTLLDANFSEIKAVNIQCKTNWNDTVQTPLLWNILYAAAVASGAHSNALGASTITFGANGRYLPNLSGFRYGFVTVPSNDPEGFSPQTSPVVRGRAFTGGCYWGRETIPHVCRNIMELFNVNGSLLPPIASMGAGAAECLNGAQDNGIQFGVFRLLP